MTTPSDRKRALEAISSSSEKELSSEKKHEVISEYLECLLKIEANDIENAKKKIRIKTLEDKFPDLKQLGGMANKVFNGKYWVAKLNEKDIVLHGKTRDDSIEAHKKKVLLETRNAEKMKDPKKSKTEQ